MFVDINKIPPYERQLLAWFNQAVERSPDLDMNQKTRIESLLQDVVDVWTKKEGQK